MDDMEKKEELTEQEESSAFVPEEVSEEQNIVGEDKTEEMEATVASEEETVLSERKEEKEKSNLFGIMIGLIVLFGMLFAVWQAPVGDVVKDTGVLYAKDGDLYLYDLKNEPYLLQENISDGGSYHYFYSAWGASCTQNNEWVYYAANVDETGGFDLYRKSVKNTAEDAVLIDTAVCDHMVSKDGKTAAYLKAEENSLKLYLFDGTENKMVAEDLQLTDECYTLSGDGKYLVYIDAYGMLCATKTNALENSIPLTDAAELYAVAEENGILYYVAQEGTSYNICSYDFKKEPTVVAEGISYMELMPNGRDLLYCKMPAEKVLYKDIILDDMAEKDAAITEADGEAYEAKLQRDTIREAMESGEGIEPLMQECYMLTGGKTVKIADNIVSAVAVDHEQPFVTGYRAKDFEPMRLSLLGGGLDMVEYIYYMSLTYGGVEAFLTDIHGNTDVLAGTMVQPDTIKVTEDGSRAAYLAANPATGGNMLFMLEREVEAEAEVIEIDVESFAFLGNDLFYEYNFEDGVSTLAMVWGDSIPGVTGVQYAEDEKLVYYIKDLDSKTGVGQMQYWDGGMEPVTIDGNIFAFQYKGNGKAALLSDYDVQEGVGDLHYFDGTGIYVLDEDITAIYMY